MAQTIKLKRSASPDTAPNASQLALGEVAINTYDGLMYIKKSDGTVIRINDRTTADLAEDPSKPYFSTTRARNAVSATGDLAYNATTGVFSYSTPDNLSDFNNDISEVTSTVPTDGSGKPTGYVWYIV